MPRLTDSERKWYKPQCSRDYRKHPAKCSFVGEIAETWQEMRESLDIETDSQFADTLMEFYVSHCAHQDITQETPLTHRHDKDLHLSPPEQDQKRQKTSKLSSCVSGEMGTQLEADGHWVTVFGFPKELSRRALQQMSRYGDITNHKTPAVNTCNWFYVRYSRMHDAEKAAKNQDAELLTSDVMIGVKLRGVRGASHFSRDQQPVCKLTISHDQLLRTTHQQLCNTLENVGNANTIDHVNVKKEMEHGEYYTQDIVRQPVNTDNQTSDINTSVQLEDNVERVLDSEGRNGKTEGKKEENQKAKMTSDEREVVIWNRENSSSEALAGSQSYTSGGISGDSSAGGSAVASQGTVLAGGITGATAAGAIRAKSQWPTVGAGIAGGQASGGSKSFSSAWGSGSMAGGSDSVDFDSVLAGSITYAGRRQRRRVSGSPTAPGASSTGTFGAGFVGASGTGSASDNVDGVNSSDSMQMSAESSQGQPKKRPAKHQCDVCSYSTSRKFDLTNHTRIHTQEKPFVCDICNKRFTRKGHCDVHTRTHTGEMPLKCKLCGMGFSHYGSLTRHYLMLHDENAKIFKCSFCEFARKDKHCVAQHEIYTHTKKYPHLCHVCGWGCMTPGLVQKHLVTKHK